MKKYTRKKRLGTKQIRNKGITGTKLEDGMHTAQVNRHEHVRVK
jgi:hypothetical protein